MYVVILLEILILFFKVMIELLDLIEASFDRNSRAMFSRLWEVVTNKDSQ